MFELLHLVDIDLKHLPFLVTDLLVAVILLGAMRYVSGIWGHFDTTEELARKDNFAFGISIAGSVLALGIVMSGVVTGSNAATVMDELLGTLLYGSIGLVLVYIGSMVHDKLSLNQINKVELIRQQNISVAIVDAGAAISSAIVIRAVLIWVEGMNFTTVIAILSGFIVSQLLLVMVTRLREARYAKVNQGEPFQKGLANGQVAIAIRHIGYLMGTAITVSAASQLLVFDPHSLVTNLLGWIVTTLTFTLLLHGLMKIAKRFILMGINLVQEVDHQENIGVAFIEMFTTLAIALILKGLLH